MAGQDLSDGIEIPIPAVARNSAFASSIAAALAVGIVGSFLPYLIWWHKTGHFVYIADPDNQYFLQLASRLYYLNFFSMTDPVLAHGATMYQSVQFVPAVLLTRILGLPALQVNAVWHLWAAVALPLSFYLVFFQWLRRPWATVFCVVVMLIDCGVLTVRPLLIQPMRLYQEVVGHFPVLYNGQDLLDQWRIVDPAVGMPLLLFQIVFVSSAVKNSKDRRMLIAAGVLTALLCYTWFYYWTAAVGALSIAVVVDRSGRWTYAKILSIGVTLGLPSVVDGYVTKSLLSSEAVRRIGVFAPVPRTGFFLLPKVALMAFLVTGVWIWRKPDRQGLYFWCLAGAALALSNNHLVSGLDLRAGHWRYVWGTVLSMLVLLMAVQFSLKILPLSRPAMAMVASAVLVIDLSAGIALRSMEVDRSLYGMSILNGYKKFTARYSSKVPTSLSANGVIAGDDEFCDLATIVDGVRPLAGYAAFLSLGVSDREWESREALNAHLEGLSEQDFQNRAKVFGRELYGWGQSADPEMGGSVEHGMMREFERIKDDPRPGIEAFMVRYVALQATRPDPDYLKSGWTLLEAGPYWRIWRKE